MWRNAELLSPAEHFISHAPWHKAWLRTPMDSVQGGEGKLNLHLHLAFLGLRMKLGAAVTASQPNMGFKPG